MGKEKFLAIMPYISADLVNMIVQKQKINEKEAIKRLYNSKLYALLEDETSKVWQYSTEMLYLLFEEEQTTGNIQFPDL